MRKVKVVIWNHVIPSLLALFLYKRDIRQEQVLLRASLVLIDRNLTKQCLILDHTRWTYQCRISKQMFCALVVKSRGFYLHFVDFIYQYWLVSRELISFVLQLVLKTPFIFINWVQGVRLVSHHFKASATFAFLLTTIASPEYLVDLLNVSLVMIEVHWSWLLVLRNQVFKD
jgi:hypothetical protein